MKKIAIMGAGGFVGRSLCKYFGDNPNEFIVLPVTRKDFSLLDEKSVYDFLSKETPDVVVNCANEGGARKNGYDEHTDIVANNLRMFFNIERAISGNTLLVNFGSGAEYNKQRDLVKVKESSLGEFMPQDAYGFSKYAMAKYIENSSHKKTINPTIFGLFGPFEDYTFKFISNACVKNLLKMDIVINQNVKFDYLYIDDFCAIIKSLIEKDDVKNKNFNITPTKSIELIKLAGLINEVSDYKSNITIKNPGLNYEYTGDNGKLLENLGGHFDFLPYKESVRRLFEYYKEHLSELDTETVQKDVAINFCKTKTQGGKL